MDSMRSAGVGIRSIHHGVEEEEEETSRSRYVRLDTYTNTHIDTGITHRHTHIDIQTFIAYRDTHIDI